MSEATNDFNRRPLIGILAVALLAIAAVLLARGSGSEYQAAGSACLRVGVLLAAVWLAYPQLEKIPTWIFGTALTGLMLVVVRPQLALVIVPALLMLWFLRSIAV